MVIQFTFTFLRVKIVLYLFHFFLLINYALQCTWLIFNEQKIYYSKKTERMIFFFLYFHLKKKFGYISLSQWIKGHE